MTPELNAQLAKLRNAADQMEVLIRSIAKKESMIDNIEANKKHFKDLPNVQLAAEQSIVELKQEIASEQEKLNEIKASVMPDAKKD